MMREMIAKLLSGILILTAAVSAAVNSQPVYVSAAQDSSSVRTSDLLRMNELYGWAAVKAEGLDGVTGGGNAAPQIVTTQEELIELAGDNIPRVIVISGQIRSNRAGILVGSNKTIVGMDENATVVGGFRIHNASNVILNNLSIQGTWPGSDPRDCIEISNSHHVWLNHLNIWNAFDGNLDMKLGCDYITVSWCKFWYNERAQLRHDHRLSCLVGSGAGDHDDTDLGKFHVTFHHNWFAEGVDQRMPRVMYGRAHIYNNYYSSENNSYCIGSDCYGAVLVENNYFQGVNDPHIFDYPDNPYPASITARGNIYSRTTGRRDEGQKNERYVVPYEQAEYDYYLNAAGDIPQMVQRYAGTYAASTQTPSRGTYIRAVQAGDKTVPAPLPSAAPVKKRNDNPVTYDEKEDTYTFHGQNSDGTNAYYEIENPFAAKDYSSLCGEQGATIAYWVKLPDDYSICDAAVLNFNLENDRQIERSSLAKYRLCQAYSPLDSSYSMGARVTYVDNSGRTFDVLESYGENVCYNPDYPQKGCYSASYDGGAYYAYRQGTDPSNRLNWKYLNYIGEGMYQNYSMRYFEKGGVNSKIQEADISGSFSLYASGSMGFRQDNWTGLQRNPYLDSYGKITAAHIFNQFFYWTNGSDYTFWGDYKNNWTPGEFPPITEDRAAWHYIVEVIQNDWVQCYMDGVELDPSYLNYYGDSMDYLNAGESFNQGYGHRYGYRTERPAQICQNSMSLLEFISDKDTVLTIGGCGLGAGSIGQDTIGTPDGVQVKGLEFYYIPVSRECILMDRIDLGLAYYEQVEAPDKSGEEDDTIPELVYAAGDVDGNERIELRDVYLTLRTALHITEFPAAFQKNAADINQDTRITLEDAQLLLKYVLKIVS